jgi:hypothetical protein
VIARKYPKPLSSYGDLIWSYRACKADCALMATGSLLVMLATRRLCPSQLLFDIGAIPLPIWRVRCVRNSLDLP